MAKSDRFYFENYATAADCCGEAAAYLQECLTNYDYANIKTMLEKMRLQGSNSREIIISMHSLT